MKINSNGSNFNFKSAVLNINTFSDNHGNLEKLDGFYQSIEQNRDELFLEDKKGNQNALVIAGDWFIAGGTKGYKSNPNANSHYFQTMFFNKFVEKMNAFTKNTKTYFVPGNHELDAGVYEFKKVLENICATVLMTNLDFKKSPVLQPLIDTNKVVKQDILEIEDDKNPNLKHKALFLGINPVNMPYYRYGIRGINFINQFAKAGKSTAPEDYKETFDETVKIIKEFKQKNPKGLVIVSSHTGVNFAQNLAEYMGKDNINLILNAHEHLDGIDEVSGVKIVNLGQNFEKYVNAKFFLDDEGDLKSDVDLGVYYPDNNPVSSKEGFFKKFYDRVFCKDLKKEYKINTRKPDISVLGIEGIRLGNNYLANFVTDAILSQIQKTNPEVQIFAINASAIRTPLDTALYGGANNIQIMNTLNGIVDEDAGLLKSTISGRVLVKLVAENTVFSETNPKRNPVTHYSGLIIDKKEILDGIHSGKSDEYLTQFIKTADGTPIDLNKTYTIANVEKYFKKSKTPFINSTLYNEAEPLNLNAKKLFVSYMNENKENLIAKCDTRIKN